MYAFRAKIFNIIDNEDNKNIPSVLFEFAVTTLIILSLISIIVESFNYNKDGTTTFYYYFDLFEQVTLGLFTLEYVLRLITADFKYKDAPSYLKAVKSFVFSSSGLVDLLAISPLFFYGLGYLGFIHYDLRFIRVLKITRLFRVLKMSTLTRSIVIVGDVFVDKRYDLGITMFVTFILLLVSSILMWFIERDAQPEQFPNIIATFWWAVATLTTVGYGDVYPITVFGKILSGIIALLGIGLVALPAGILSSAFIEKLEESSEQRKKDTRKQKVLVQAKYPEVSGKVSSEKCNTTATVCSGRFGEAFVYCPYCGKPIDQHE